MATVNFKVLKGKTNSNIYCRFSQGSSIDVISKIDVYVDAKNWDQKNQKIKNVIAIKNRDAINRKLSQLKIEIIDNYNLGFMEGEVIDRIWLVNIINGFFNRPKFEDKKDNKHALYYVNFAEWWIENKSASWLTSANTYMNDRTKSQYNSFIELVKEFQGKSKIKLGNSGSDTIAKFVKWMVEGGYASKTIKRHSLRFKFFFARAKELGFKIDPTYEQRVFVPKSEEVLEPYLNEDEIKLIYNYDFSYSETLDNVRDNLIIAVYSGMRISDFMTNLNLSNFIDDEIHIKTMKTGTSVVIPLHPFVKKILLKRNGKLPKKISDPKFNILVKEVCRKAGINDLMKGRLYDGKTKRKVLGSYFKWQLVSSHIGRRSFCTNLVSKIDDTTIMKIAGWSSKDMMYNYIKKTNSEHANKLKEYWIENSN